MKHWLFFLFFTFFCNFLYASEIEVIELHEQNADVDQGLLNNLNQIDSENISKSLDENIIDEDLNESNNEEKSQNEDSIPELNNEVSILPNLWENADKDNLYFLLSKINSINSNILKYELISLLDIKSPTPKDLNKEDFENIIITNLIKFGDRESAYNAIKSLYEVSNKEYDTYYKEFELNYLLSTYKVSEACDLRSEFKNINFKLESNFLLKFDIFCLLLQEKFDEASLMNSLLLESDNEDHYFNFLFNKINNFDLNNLNDLENYLIDKKDIHLFSAMHRVANIPLSQKFLDIDPINLSMPIVLSNSSNINLRLKAAHIAFKHKILGADSLSALYQVVDFNSEELNNPSKFEQITKGNIEIGMAYYYQLSNIQILPITRLEAILDFWNFAKKNNLEHIAYELSLKDLNTIEPSTEYSDFAADIVNAYIKSQNFENANKWLPFIDYTNNNQLYLEKAESSKLLINLNNLNDKTQFISLLKKHLINLSKIIQDNDSNSDIRSELLYILFYSLDNIEKNPFYLNLKITESRSMPSSYILDNIKNCIVNQNYSELILFIIASLEGKDWTNLHPEHLRLILEGLKNYKDGIIFNEVIMEIIYKNNII
tara:strand:- start:1903 stop:3711 length:1809 start_codon:yes stop_codon:yes gene_type:complete